MATNRRKLWILITVFSMWIGLSISVSPVPYPKSAGIYPEGSIIKNVGEDINITCYIGLDNSSGKNSSNLWFYIVNKPVPSENIIIHNETSIIFTIKNAPKMSKSYVCKEDGQYGIDYSKVIVGTPPEPVTNFECTSYDYEYFKCNFTVPPNNPVPTSYNLSYYIQEQVYDCPLLLNGGGEYICNITMDNNLYRQVYEYYTFHLFSKNQLGNLSQNFTINHFDRVIPAKPELVRTNLTADSVTFEWQILKISRYAKKELEYETMIMADCEKQWQMISMEDMQITRVNRTAFRAKLSNLEFAHMWYDIRMRMKVKTAKNDGSMWSATFNDTFRTLERKPDEPPKTDIGSFHIDPFGYVHLYWEMLPKYKENGRNFTYVITEIQQNGQLVKTKPKNFNATTSAKFRLDPADYEFTIKSENRVGISNSGSTIRIFKNNFAAEYPEPQWLRKIYHQQKYTLSWNAPRDATGLVDYTVFWCASQTASSDQCNGTISFKHISKKNTNITHEEEGNSSMNFAVSANYEKYSSGMVWAMCTALKTSDFRKMRPMLSLSGSTTVKIIWSLECVYSSILDGYYLMYCPISKDPSALDPECQSTATNVTVPKNATEFIIENLKPYTTYKFIMSMYSSEKQSPPSDPVFLTTVETAPTPPNRLQYKNLTSNSVTLIWDAPDSLNGRLRYYEIIYNGDKIKVEGDGLSNESRIVYTLNSLRSFYDYKVYVVARTVEDSKPSNDIHFKTKIGIPGVVGNVNHTTDYSDVTFSWEPPVVPSGRLEYYEVRSMFLRGNQPQVNLISRVNGTRCHLRLPPCPDNSHSFQFSVRAVNAVEKDQMDYHTFSKRDTSAVNSFIHIDTVIEADIADITKRVGPIFKRHSHAEIDASHESQFIHTDKIRHNRQEREETRNHHVHVHQIEDFLDERHGFKCVEDHDLSLQKWLDNHGENLRFLKGEWKTLPSYVCNYKNDTKRRVLLGAGVLCSVTLITIFTYFGCQKYKRMKNIIVVFPPGLTDLDQDVHKGVDNIIKDINRSDESLFKNENHHLLASIGNDSGYLHGIDCSDKSDGYDLSDHSAPTDSVEMSEISDSSNGSPGESPNVVRSEKTAVPTATMVNPIIINGYVQQQSFQIPPESAFNGYTTLDAFGKPIIPINIAPDSDAKHKELPQNCGMNENICGYVTHKQLSEFGHRLQ